jgi:hypothetical protein
MDAVWTVALTARSYGELGNAAIPVLGGIYLLLLTSRVIGKKRGVDTKYDAKVDRLKWFGPILIVIGIVYLLIGLMRF